MLPPCSLSNADFGGLAEGVDRCPLGVIFAKIIPGDVSLPNRTDTDGDGLNDSEEINLGADGFATDPWIRRPLLDAFNSLTVHPNGRTMKDYRKIAEDFARHLKAKYGDRIERIILFGSVARGDYREDSDVDLIVVTRENRLAFLEEVVGEAIEVLLATGVYPSVKVLTPEEMDRIRDTLFGRAVAAEGVALG